MFLAGSLVKAPQDIGETMGELGLAFVKLTKFEREEALSDSQRVGATYMKIKQILEGIKFTDSQTSVMLHSKIEKLEVASSKIFGGDRSRLCKIEKLSETVRVTEDAKSCAMREYELIKENNRSELERFDRERHDVFMSMLKGFVVNEVIPLIIIFL
ncbi:hypothetical protein CFOL_v3_32855 [Cephalotus follicularis]|uniref:Uncharacterized protein n=1 Tax=Cephalotus follicularis TaxID=3775 RepID=A0A1Q3DAH1_CEPFO|nr:hypothetical protein CFOL_v3_32855 [Cephalotus follicularis]